MQQQEVCTISSIVFVRYVDPHLQCVSHVHPLLPPSAKGTQINSMYQKDMPLSAMIALLVLGAIPKTISLGFPSKPPNLCTNFPEVRLKTKFLSLS